MKRFKTRFLLSMMLSLCVALVFGQQKRVSGTVTDDKGLPVAGATYNVKKTTISGATDASGRFTVDVPNANSVLVFTSVGYVTKEVAVGASTVLNVRLSTAITAMNEVVVTALGVTKQNKKLGYACLLYTSRCV